MSISLETLRSLAWLVMLMHRTTFALLHCTADDFRTGGVFLEEDGNLEWRIPDCVGLFEGLFQALILRFSSIPWFSPAKDESHEHDDQINDASQLPLPRLVDVITFVFQRYYRKLDKSVLRHRCDFGS